MRSMRVRGRSQALASAPADKLSGRRNSSRRTSPGCKAASFLAILVIPICSHAKLVVVGDLHVFRACLGPDEAHPKLIGDPDRMLSITIPAQGFKPTTDMPLRRSLTRSGHRICRRIEVAKTPENELLKFWCGAALQIRNQDR